MASLTSGSETSLIPSSSSPLFEQQQLPSTTNRLIHPQAEIMEIVISTSHSGTQQVADLVAAFQSYGHTVRVASFLNSALLVGADALIIGAPRYGYFQNSEISAVVNWFNAGKKFLWVGCTSDVWGDAVAYNCSTLLAAVGSKLRLEPTEIIDYQSNAGGYWRVVANTSESVDPDGAAISQGIDNCLFYETTIVYGMDGVDPVDLETHTLPDVFNIYYTGAAAQISDWTPVTDPPIAHTNGQTGNFVVLAGEKNLGPNNDSLIIVSGSSPIGLIYPMLTSHLSGVQLAGPELVIRAITIIYPPLFFIWPEYLIITVNATAVNDFAAWKRQKGVSTIVTTTTWIYTNCLGADNAEQIWNHIHWWHQLSPWLKWVLLVGDSGTLPPRYVYLPDHGEQGGLSPTFKPTDYYYAVMDDTDWDEDNDGRWGECNTHNIGGPTTDEIDDWQADLSVGRVPFDDGNMIMTYLARAITYEKTPGLFSLTGWSSFLMAGSILNYDEHDGLNDDDGTDEAEVNDEIDDNILPAHYVVNRYYEDHPTLYWEYTPTNVYTDLTNTIVSTSINTNSPALINLADHGAMDHVSRQWDSNGDGDPPYTWGTIYSAAQASASTASIPGFGYGSACLTGAFDWSGGTSLAEAMLQGTAIGYVGATRVSWYYLGRMTNSYNWGLNRYQDYDFWDLFFGGTTNHRPGDTLYTSKNNYVTTFSSIHTQADWETAHRKNMLTYVLFGDPELQLRTFNPWIIIVPFLELVPYINNYIYVTDYAGAPLANASVCLRSSSGNNRYYEVAVTNASGYAEVYPQGSLGDDVDVVITAHNAIAYETTVSLGFTVDVNTPIVTYTGGTTQSITINVTADSPYGMLTTGNTQIARWTLRHGATDIMSGNLTISALYDWMAENIAVADLAEGSYYVNCYFEAFGSSGEADSIPFEIVHVITISTPIVSYDLTTQTLDITTVTATCSYTAHGTLDNTEATTHTYRVYNNNGSSTTITGNLGWTGSDWEILDVDVSSLSPGTYYVRCTFADSDCPAVDSANSLTFQIVEQPPPIPGFPPQAIIIGLIIAVTIGVIVRRRKH